MTDLDAVRSRLGSYEPGSIRDRLTQDDYGPARDRGGAAYLKAAAVLIPIIAHDTGPALLMTVRNPRMKRHAGQVAFPGGRADPGETAEQTALREAHEEVDLPPGAVEVVGAIDRYRTGTGYLITPVVGIVPPGLPLTPHEAEVSEVFELPLAHALDTANHIEDAAEWNGALRRYYTIDWRPQRVWGATAGIIVNLARILGS